MKKYAILVLMVFVIFMGSIELVSAQSQFCLDDCTEKRNACKVLCPDIKQDDEGWRACTNDCNSRFYSRCWDACEAERKAEPAPSSSPVTSTPTDTTDYDAGEAQRQAEHEERMAEIQDDIDRIRAETAEIRANTAKIKEETAAMKVMFERLDNGEVTKDEIPCSDIKEARLRDMMQWVEDEYAKDNEYVGRHGLTSNDKLLAMQKEDNTLECFEYNEIPLEEQIRIKQEKKRIADENALAEAEAEAYEDMQKRVENKEMAVKEAACNSLSDPRVVQQLKAVRAGNAADGKNIGRAALTSDKKLYVVQIVDDELHCYGYRGAGVKDVVPENREIRGTVKVDRGGVKVLRDGLITPVTSGYEVRAGDAIKADRDGIIGIVSKDGLVQLSGDTVVGFIGLEFDPVEDSRLISPPDAPWAPDPGSFKLEVDNNAFWKALYDDLVDFHIENPPAHLKSCAKFFAGDPLALTSCGADTAAFVYGGTAWFEKKIDEDFPPGMVLTPAVAITTTGTKFTVEVADDGSTTVTTLDGSVVVTDLTSRKSASVSTNDQLMVPKTSTGSEEKELKQSLTKVDSNSIDKWWSEKLAQENTVEAGGLQGILYILVGFAFWLIVVYVAVKYIIKLIKYIKKKRKKKK